MIPRTLVPTDVRPLENGEARKPPRRLTTYMDDRTVVPSDLSEAPPLTGKTSIPAHLPLDVLIDRTLVPRGMAPKPFENIEPWGEHVPLAILDSRVVVPAFVERPEQKEIDRFDQPPEMTAQLREVVEPDVFLTGEANLLVEGEDKRDAKENAITRAASVLAHIAFIVFLVFLPKIFPPHVPTQSEIELASKELGVVYLPPDAGALSRAPSPPPGPAVKISPKVLNKVAPPRPEEHAIEAPPARNPERPPSDLPSAPTPQPNRTPPPPTAATPPVDSASSPSRLLPAAPQPVPGHLNLGLPSASPGREMQDQLQDAVKHAGSGTYSTGGSIPRGAGGGGRGGGGGGQVGNAVTILTPTEGVDFNSYITRLVARVKQNWYAVMPESAYMGDKGIVAITFRINRDGSFPSENYNLERTSGKDPLDTAAMSAIRTTNPFDPLPPQFKGPYIELRFIFFYNIPINNAQ
ncbi:MAG: TonB C-terminal domain-containing protein [Candidatus Acidiferrales bacterium]